jgi:ribonuclease-3 family protein
LKIISDTLMTEDAAVQLNPLVLAFIGDAVMTLYIRTKLVMTTGVKTNILHKMAAGVINATSQSKKAEQLMEEFSESEKAIFLRARNSKTNTVAKNASVTDYKKASGLEAVIGFLYLTGQNDRLEQILNY